MDHTKEITALLLIAHGSRVHHANEDLQMLAARLREIGNYPVVQECYLELAAPDIQAGARKCTDQGARRIVMLPYFLSAGVHVEHDLEAARHEILSRHPEVDVMLAKPIGLHPMILEVIQDRAREAETIFSKSGR